MDYARVILKWKWFIALFFILAVVLAGALSEFVLPEVYEVKTGLEIGEMSGVLESPTQVVEKINNETYLHQLAQEEFFFSGLEAKSPEGTNLVSVRAKTVEPEKTKETLTNLNHLIVLEHEQEWEKRKGAIEEEIAEISQEVGFIKERKIYTESIAPLYLKISSLKQNLSEAKPTRVVKPPVVSEGLVGPNTKLNVAVAGMLALFSGVFIAFVAEWWRENA